MAGNSKTNILNRFCNIMNMMADTVLAPFNPSYYEMNKPKPVPVKVSSRNEIIRKQSQWR
tara:strand:- start:323 stop:502 length:180 start_codon:yes stop_codon:yes gene_type:complete